MRNVLRIRVSRKVTSLLIVMAVMVTACSAEQIAASPPATNAVMPVTQTAEPDPVVTPSATTATDEGSGTIPVTGDLNPGRLSNLLRFLVFNQAGEQLGEVYDLIMDLDASSISYVVVTSGGFLNVEQKMVAVPWSALQVSANHDASAPGFFSLAVDQELFLNAPEINLADGLPEMGQAAGDWDDEIRAYWGLSTPPTEQPSPTVTPFQPSPSAGTLQPTPEGMPLTGIILASKALGFDFQLQGEEALNVSIDDMIINIESGKILYVVIHTNFENAREQWVPIPYSLLQWDLDRQAYILNVDMVTLQSAPFYIDSLYPDTTRRGWDDLYVFFWKEHGLTSRP